MAAGICFIGHFLLPPTAYFFNRLFCVRNVSPTAHFSQQLEKWAKEPFETDGFKTSFALKSCVRYGL